MYCKHTQYIKHNVLQKELEAWELPRAVMDLRLLKVGLLSSHCYGVHISLQDKLIRKLILTLWHQELR